MHVSQLKLPHPASQLGSSFSSEQNAGHESDIIKPLPLSEASPSVSGLSYLNSEWSDKAPVEKGLAKGTLASPEYALAAKRRAQKYASLHAPQDGPQDTPHGPFNNPSPSPSVARPASQSGDALVKQTALTRVVADSPPPASVGRWERRDNIHRRWLASNTARKAAPASTFAESQVRRSHPEHRCLSTFGHCILCNDLRSLRIAKDAYGADMLSTFACSQPLLPEMLVQSCPQCPRVKFRRRHQAQHHRFAQAMFATPNCPIQSLRSSSAATTPQSSSPALEPSGCIQRSWNLPSAALFTASQTDRKY